MTKATARVPSAIGRGMTRHDHKTPRPWVPAHIGGIIPVRVLFEQPSCISLFRPWLVGGTATVLHTDSEGNNGEWRVRSAVSQWWVSVT